MDCIPARFERSLRKSRNRLRILFALNSLGETYLGQLSRMTGISHQRLKGVLHGDMPYYREELSLVGLGLAEVEITPTGRIYRITPRGRRKARSWAKRRHDR